MKTNYEFVKSCVDYLKIFRGIDASQMLELNGNPAIATEKANRARDIAMMFTAIAKHLDSIADGKP